MFISELSISFRSGLELVDRVGCSSVNFLLLDVVESADEETDLLFVQATISEVLLSPEINSLLEPFLLSFIVFQL